MVEVNRTISKHTISGACQMISSETISISTISIWVDRSSIQMIMLYSAIRAADMIMTMVQIMNTIEIKTIMEIYGHEGLAKTVIIHNRLSFLFFFLKINWFKNMFIFFLLFRLFCEK